MQYQKQKTFTSILIYLKLKTAADGINTGANIMTTKEFNQNAKNGKDAINVLTKSPFAICKSLNNRLRETGKVTHIEGLGNIDLSGVHAVADTLKTIMPAVRYAFNVDFFVKDYRGRFCEKVAYKGTERPATDGQIITDKGREIVSDEKGEAIMLRPVVCTEAGMFAAFARIAREYVKAEDTAARKAAKEAKTAERAEKAAQKAAAKVKAARAIVEAAFGSDYTCKMDDADVLKRAELIKAAAKVKAA